MSQRIKNKVVFVTGAGQGIGRSISLRFAQEGADVALNDVNLDNVQKVAEEIKKTPHPDGLPQKTKVILGDVSKLAEVKRMHDELMNEFGRIDILVNNAGIARIVPFVDMTEKIWDKIMDVNLKGTFLCCLVFVPEMIKQKYGKIINMSSKSGKTGNTAFAAYCAAKFGVIGMTQSLALELAPYNIRVNAICPGIVFTPHWDELGKQYAAKRNMPAEEVKEYLVGRIPLGKPQSPEDIANLALFLASDESNQMTGQAINITGGQEFH